ncbi:hypothetical protein [Nocardioides aromaticivorans]|uniref:hypothetical protein n=1 Tax=Nocardioides aromaticivorans TaxID=200618 RepID=UPI001A9013F4|nr:hypothetical protein [Nocardioides aromaticivorans]
MIGGRGAAFQEASVLDFDQCRKDIVLLVGSGRQDRKDQPGDSGLTGVELSTKALLVLL